MQRQPEALAEALQRGDVIGDKPATLNPAARMRLRTNTHQAMRLRAVSAPASNASTNDQAKLVSGKLNR